MKTEAISLKILLPYKVFLQQGKVRRLVIETRDGSYGLLPGRLDCVADLVPGILTFEDENGKEIYIAVDEGIMVKENLNVLVSVRKAIAGEDLTELREAVKKEFITLTEEEKDAKQVMAKLGSNFLSNLDKFYKD